MDKRTRQLVCIRANDKCEYCKLPQSALPYATFHVEHSRAKQHGGTDDLGNLALACGHCNRHKGPNLSGIDPVTNQVTLLFNPRDDEWSEHFAVRGVMIVGLTPVGRATVHVLKMNSRRQRKIRADLI
jgi:5-methylcytosine-specific restriction endonuclease McrA